MVNTFSILDLIKCPYFLDPDNELIIIKPKPAKGLLWITKSSPYFLQGRMTLRGRDKGRYPYKILDVINYIFGYEKHTIEVCSGPVNKQLMIATTDNATALPDSTTLLLNDAIERLQNGDLDEALLYLNLVNKQLPSEPSDKQTGFVPGTNSSNLTTTDSNENRTKENMTEAPPKEIVPLDQAAGGGEQDTFSIKSGNKTYPIKYAINNGTVNNVTLSSDQTSMIVNLSTTDIGMLGIELPREIIDSKGSDNKTDEDYFVLADGLLTGWRRQVITTSQEHC